MFYLNVTIMKTAVNKITTVSLSSFSKAFFLFTGLFIAFSNSVLGQDLKNLKHSLGDIEKEQKNIAHQEFMSYVYMVLGFSVVIAIAWISTVKARNRSRVEAEAKAKFIQHKMETRKANGTLHKARR